MPSSRLAIGLVLAASTSGASNLSLDAPGADPPLFALSIAHRGLRRSTEFASEAGLEYRSAERLWILKPFGGVMANSAGTVYAFAGLLLDIYWGEHFVLTPSLAGGFYSAGQGKDLGSPIEFRSQVELSYLFLSSSRIGIGMNHISNAKLGRVNPGIEGLSIIISTPGVFGR